MTKSDPVSEYLYLSKEPKERNNNSFLQKIRAEQYKTSSAQKAQLSQTFIPLSSPPRRVTNSGSARKQRG